jgi:hypothetical protein
MLTGMTLWGAGDLLAQKFERQETWDWKRTIRFGAYGLLFAGMCT